MNVRLPYKPYNCDEGMNEGLVWTRTLRQSTATAACFQSTACCAPAGTALVGCAAWRSSCVYHLVRSAEQRPSTSVLYKVGSFLSSRQSV